MLRHIVMWRFRDVAEGATKAQNLQKAKEMLESLKRKIAEIQSLEVGLGVTEGEQAYDLVLNTHFENTEKLLAYQAHPEHVKVVDFLRKVQTQKAVADYEC